MAKIYHVTPGPDGWQVEILDEDRSEGSEGLEEPAVVLGGGWIGAERVVVHRTVLTRQPDGSVEGKYTARNLLRKRVRRRRPWWS